MVCCGSPHAQFELLLKQLVGSQDSIQASKDWVVSRLGHYAVNIAWRLRVFAKETEVAAGGEGPKALPRSKVHLPRRPTAFARSRIEIFEGIEQGEGGYARTP